MIEIERVDPASAGPGFAAELADLWYRVSRAGGAVGFGPDVRRAEVDAATERVLGELEAGTTSILAARDGERLVGAVRLERGAAPVVRHRAMLKMLMVDPDRQRSGLGRRLIDACLAEAARAEIEQVYLSARSGTGLEEYYPRLGWREVGRFPGGVRVGPGDARDEIWYLREVPRHGASLADGCATAGR